MVFGSIVNEGYINENSHDSELRCVFNQNEDACNYSIAIGIIAFFACIFFFIIDLYFQQISSVKDRKRVVLLDLGFSGMPGAVFCWQWRLPRAGLRQSDALDAPAHRDPFALTPKLKWLGQRYGVPFAACGRGNRTPCPLKQ